MGISAPRYYDPYYYPPPRYYYPPPPIYINQPALVPIPTIIPPSTVPVVPNGRVIVVSPTQPTAFPMNVPPPGQTPNLNTKKAIENILDFVEEQELTESILEKGRQKNCSICLENYFVGDKIIYLPCFHYYHSKCIATWVKSSDKCPLCNTEINFQ